MGLFGFIAGGALQGIGQGMEKSQLVRDQERRDAALAKMKQESSTQARQLEEAGFKPGTPEFQAKMREIINAGLTGKPQIITPQPGGGAFARNSDGSVTTLVQPNPGDKPFGSPAGAGSPITKRINGVTYYQGSDGKWYDNASEAGGSGGPASAPGAFR